MDNESRKLWDAVSVIVDKHRHQRRISPAWIATEAMNELDPERLAPHLIYLGCHLQLRQIARGLCRTRYEGDAKPADQHELFHGLQWRYPSAASASSEEAVYVRLEYLTKADIAYNVERLRREGEAKIEHADALANYSRKRHPNKGGKAA